MADVKIRSASLYIKGKKAGEATGFTYDIDSNDEPQIGDDGYLGHSEGVTTTSLSFNSIVPVKGMQVAVLSALVEKKSVDVALSLIDGKIHQITMRVTKATVKSTRKNGTLDGDFQLGGGEPKITG